MMRQGTFTGSRGLTGLVGLRGGKHEVPKSTHARMHSRPHRLFEVLSVHQSDSPIVLVVFVHQLDHSVASRKRRLSMRGPDDQSGR